MSCGDQAPLCWQRILRVSLCPGSLCEPGGLLYFSVLQVPPHKTEGAPMASEGVLQGSRGQAYYGVVFSLDSRFSRHVGSCHES